MSLHHFAFPMLPVTNVVGNHNKVDVLMRKCVIQTLYDYTT